MKYKIVWSGIEEIIEAKTFSEACARFNELHPETHDGFRMQVYYFSHRKSKFIFITGTLPSKW